MQDNILYRGVNAPRIHQEVITKLVAELYFLHKNGKTKLKPYPETMINESETSPMPDLMLLDPEGLPVVLIEITHTAVVKKDFQKMIDLMSEYDVREGFVYDYRKQSWRKYRYPDGEILQQPSFCEAIIHDLNDFLS